MGINLVVAVTDDDWFEMLSGGIRTSARLISGHRPQQHSVRCSPVKCFSSNFIHRNGIVGGGIFTYANTMPCFLAWAAFGEANGAHSPQEMRTRIARYRRTDPFEEANWILVPSSWSPNFVSFKTYNTGDAEGIALWEAVNDRLSRLNAPVITEARARFGEPQLIRPRLGQGAFRVLVTDYLPSALRGHTGATLPALEAAHIRPYGEGGEHEPRNGLLLRRDIHSLFDAGYVTVTPSLHFEVSRRIREELSGAVEP